MQASETVRASEIPSGDGDDVGRAAGDRSPEERGRGRRLFMAGRVNGDVQQVRFAPSTRAPIRGPWSLDLVVRAG